jgi:hypothetical protein
MLRATISIFQQKSRTGDGSCLGQRSRRLWSLGRAPGMGLFHSRLTGQLPRVNGDSTVTLFRKKTGSMNRTAYPDFPGVYL